MCDWCGREVVRVEGIRHPLEVDPQPYSDGVLGWAFSRSRGWVQSSLQHYPPSEHLVDHYYVCGGRYEAQLMRDLVKVPERHDGYKRRQANRSA